jgi:hypothetical protein
MCGGKKSAPPVKPTITPYANPNAVADNTNEINPGSKIMASTNAAAQEQSFGSELGASTATTGVQ